MYFYNSYLGSIDIDVVGESLSGGFVEVIERYERVHGYEFLFKDPLGLEVVSRKPILREGNIVGYMEIDACTVEDPVPARFHEDESKKLSYSLCLLDDNRRPIELPGETHCYIPRKSLLLLYKVKAARDRSYDLKIHRATLAPERVDFLRAKVAKDLADILALLDPAPRSYVVNDSLDPRTLSKIVSDFDLHFALETIRALPLDKKAIQTYSPNLDPSNVGKWVDEALSRVPSS